MLVLTGKVVDLSTREAGSPGSTWVEHLIHVLEGRRVHDVKVGKDFGDAPEVGDEVALEVYPRLFVTKAGAPGVQYTAVGRCEAGVLPGLRAVG